VSIRIAFLVALPACYSPSYTSCDITCVGLTCPSGLDCVAGLCVAPGKTCGPGSDGDGGTDAVDGSGVDAANGTPWGAPTQLVFPQLPTPPNLDDPSVRDDMLEMYANLNETDLVRLSRFSPTAAWGAPTLITELDMNVAQDTPEIFGDGLTLMWSLRTSQTLNLYDLRWTGRASTTGANSVFATPVFDITGVNSSGFIDSGPTLSRDQRVLYFSSERDGTADIYVTTRPAADAASPWSAPQRVTALNVSDKREEGPRISEDGLVIYFASDRSGNFDLFYATRPSTSDAFGVPVPITELNTQDPESDPWVSPDGKTIYFARINPITNASSIWTATR
jgi:hypothetical protein